LYALSGIFRTFFDGYYRPRSNQQYNHLATDIQQDPFCRWLSKKYVFQGVLWAYAGILTATGYGFFGWKGLFATWLTMVFIYNLGDAVNSVGHLRGRRGAPFHQARNNHVLGFLGFGEGWHANHHDQADEANFGKSNHRFDAGFAFMRLLSFLGLLKFTK
jgi:stearoyl-CoA desaturase (delta-9 desaturase)